MKQSSIIDSIVSQISSLSNNDYLNFTGFHPDLFLPLIGALGPRIFVKVSNDKYNIVIKHLFSLWEDERSVFVGGGLDGGGGVAGFDSEESLLMRRAGGLFADGVGAVRLIVCSSSGISVPVVGSGVDDMLSFDRGVDFDDCLRFLNKECYRAVDCVYSPGEYSKRGGIIDVFPRSFLYPCRINFLDGGSSVFRFDVDTQLTVSGVKNFNLISSSGRGLLPLKEVSLNSFLLMEFLSNNDLLVGGGHRCAGGGDIKTVSFHDFCNVSKDLYKTVAVCSDLYSIGVSDEQNNLIVPDWFLNKRPSVSALNNSPGGGFVPVGLSEINRGDYLVHRDHGVGVCSGLSLVGGSDKQEFLVIKYGDGGVVSVDVGKLDLISFFARAGTGQIVLDSLSKQGVWSRKKSSAKKRAEDVVRGLLDLYVGRHGVFRAPFLQDKEIELNFLSGFPYKETPDQVSAWEDISGDLSSGSPMDRLLCGDVGFGKTELAIRAAFRVALSGRRVVVLAPTTILANQLYSSFSSRLEPFAISVDIISRFKVSSEVDLVKKKIGDGCNNVLIGTHALLNDDIYLNNVGLLIIDEEHRFGVKQKEGIRSCKKSVDVLSLSATPIPRSINLALSGLCSISMLQTPPLLRRPINTRVKCFDDDFIRSSIGFEVGRGGQVYFIHNDIAGLKNIVYKIRSFFPNHVTEFIHGKEPAHKIEIKMGSFVVGKIDILVCTSIVGSGIDVPAANCIIINKSHLFGLSQLYQLRGRVGRGQQQAHAYLLVPRNARLSDRAYKRIRTIEKNTVLGSGYNVALSDMKIRGSGSLFGYRQSGGSGSVGYEMYTRLIQGALHGSVLSKSNFLISLDDISVVFFSLRMIPESYVSVEGVRMSIYKNLSCASDDEALDGVLAGLVDRFGPAPRPLINLINESRLRLRATFAGINSIVRRGCGVEVSFVDRNNSLFSASLFGCVEDYWGGSGVPFHFLPSKSACFCLHLSEGEDSYTLLSRFIDKFIVLLG